MDKLDGVREVLGKADRIDLSEGKRAYSAYNRLLRRLSEYYNIPFPVMVGCFAATSPNNDYLKNLRSAVSLVDGYVRGKRLNDITVSTYRACAERAWRVLNGEHFLSFTQGQKTRAFYQNIIDPFDPKPITVDGHMISIWMGRRLILKDAVRFEKHYQLISDAVRTVADEAELIPNQVQAICWFTWKRIHKPVRGDGQLYLLDGDDHWRTNLQPDDVLPFPHKVREIYQQVLPFSDQQTLWPT